MGKKLIIIVAVLALVGCTTSRYKANDKYMHIETDHAKIRSVSDRHYDIKNIIDSIFVTHTFQFDIYDTEHPDSSGNYPIIVHGESETKASNIAESQEIRIESKDEIDTINYKSKEDIVEHIKKEAKTGNRWWLITFISVIALFFVLFDKLNKEN